MKVIYKSYFVLHCIVAFGTAGIGGSGRQSTAKLAAFMAGFGLFQMEITKNYMISDWREDLRKLIKQAGVDGTSMVFLFGDHQIKVSDHHVLELNLKRFTFHTICCIGNL